MNQRENNRNPRGLPRLLKVLIISAVVMFLPGCERSVEITLERGDPPTFKLNGSGDVLKLEVCEITPDGKLPKKGEGGVWTLVARTTIRVNDLGYITYGQVPTGFSQSFPNGSAPTPLREGQVYAFGAETRGAPGGDVWFIIRQGKAVRVGETDRSDPDMR